MNDTRQEILKVAAEQFAAMEYSAVKLEDIARMAHVSRAPLYYYYGSKEGLYRAVVGYVIDESRARMDELLGAEGDIFEIIEKEYAYCVRELGKYHRIWYPGPDAPDCDEQVSAFLQWLLSRKLEVFKAARARGELSPDRDVSELVTLIYVFYNGILDVKRSADSLEGFDRGRLENSEEWFMDIIRHRYGKSR